MRASESAETDRSRCRNGRTAIVANRLPALYVCRRSEASTAET
jgi:hypothetical protein